VGLHWGKQRYNDKGEVNQLNLDKERSNSDSAIVR
jgi:hypothetical protein